MFTIMCKGREYAIEPCGGGVNPDIKIDEKYPSGSEWRVVGTASTLEEARLKIEGDRALGSLETW